MTHEAARRGHVELLEWLLENGAHFNPAIVCAAACGGHVDILKFLAGRKIPLWPMEAVGEAVGEGHLEPVKFFFDNASEIFAPKVDFKSWLAEKINGNASLELLKYLREQDVPWEVPFPHLDILTLLANSANLETLQWLVSEGVPWSVLAIHNLVSRGDIEILNWARDVKAPFLPDIYYAMDADFNTFKWLYENFGDFGGTHYNSRVITNCLEDPRVTTELLDWLVEKNFTMLHPTDLVTQSVFSNKIEIIEWALGKGGEFSEDAFDVAAYNQNVEVLKYLMKKRCPIPSGFSALTPVEI
jgi:hypothetical protein